jgi:hypothetical protein
MNKALVIASVLMAAALTGIFSTSAYASVAGDESETDTEQEIKQKNVCSGWAICTNIATGAIAP